MVQLSRTGPPDKADAASGEPAVPRREVIGAWVLLAGYGTLLLGMVWDGQWHGDVGPDTFFTAPHLLLYTGPGVIGLTCLTVVLLTTWGVHGPSSTPATTVFRTFRAPLPFLVGGIGAAGNLVYGSADLWWHDVYGFDVAVPATPSHMGLALSIQVEIVGMVLAFAVLRRTRAQLWGLALAVAIATIGSAAAFGMVSEAGFEWVPGLAPRIVGLTAVGALALSLVAGLTRSARWPAAAGLAFVVVQGALALFGPAATRWYADAIDQPMREYATNQPQALIGYPVTFPLIALAASAIVWWAVRREARPTTVMAVLGVLVGVNTAVFYYALGVEMALTTTMAAAVVVGTGMGWLGWQCSHLIRNLDRQDARDREVLR